MPTQIIHNRRNGSKGVQGNQPKKMGGCLRNGSTKSDYFWSLGNCGSLSHPIQVLKFLSVPITAKVP